VTIYINIERDRESRSSAEGARFRVRVYAQPGGHALLVSTKLLPSVTKARGEAEAVFGELEWAEGAGDVRSSAMLEWE